MNDFKVDLKLSERPEILNAFDKFYKEKFGDDIEIHRTHNDMKAQELYGCDVVIVLNNGIKFTIDEKLRRNRYKTAPEYVIETIKNTNTNALGWFYTSVTQHICFGTLNKEETDVLYFFMFPLSLGFKQSIKNHYLDFKQITASTQGYNGKLLYNTICILVHYKTILKYAGRNNCYQMNLPEFHIDTGLR